MSVLVDSSVWIDFLRGGKIGDDRLEWLIDEGMVVTNNLILAELLPALMLRGEAKLVDLLREIPRMALEIDWAEIVETQVVCLRNGINGVGIPDLIIAQHATLHGLTLFTYDRHFHRMADHLGLNLLGA